MAAQWQRSSRRGRPLDISAACLRLQIAIALKQDMSRDRNVAIEYRRGPTRPALIAELVRRQDAAARLCQGCDDDIPNRNLGTGTGLLEMGLCK